jgi:hypothetical protein
MLDLYVQLDILIQYIIKKILIESFIAHMIIPKTSNRYKWRDLYNDIVSKDEWEQSKG